MAKFRVTDNQTGRSVVVSGGSAPSEAEAEEIFKAAGLRKSQKPSNTLENVARFLFPQNTGAILDLPQKLAEKDAARPSAKGNLPQAVKNAAASTLDLAQGTVLNPKLLAEDLAWILPFGKSLKGTIGLGAGAGGLAAASQPDATPGSIAVGAGTGAVASGVLKGAGALAGATAQKVGGVVENQGRDFVLKALKPSNSQQKNFKKAVGKDLADWLDEQKISGNFLSEVEDRIDNLQSQFDDLALNSGVKVEKGKLQEAFIRRINELKTSVIPSVKTKADDLQKVLDNVIGKHGDTIDVQQLTTERRAIDSLLKESQFGMPAEQASFLRSARDALQETVQDATKGIGKKDLKTIGGELRELFEFRKIAEAQEHLGKGTDLLSLGRLLSATAGASVMGLPGIVGGIALSTASKNPRVIRGGSQVLRGAGSQLQNLPRIGDRMEPLKRALRNITSSQMSQNRLP